MQSNRSSVHDECRSRERVIQRRHRACEFGKSLGEGVGTLVWSPDGRYLLCLQRNPAETSGARTTWLVAEDGPRVFPLPTGAIPWRWTPDNRLAYIVYPPGGQRRVSQSSPLAIWSADPETFTRFPMRSYARFMDNHGLLGLAGRPQWRTVCGGSRTYVEALIAPIWDRIRLNTPVEKIVRIRTGEQGPDAV